MSLILDTKDLCSWRSFVEVRPDGRAVVGAYSTTCQASSQSGPMDLVDLYRKSPGKYREVCEEGLLAS